MSKNTTKSLRLSLLFVLPNHNSLISSKIHWSYFQLFFDVSNRNIEPGKRVGVHTVWESKRSSDLQLYKYKTEFKATCVFYLSVLLGSASGCGPISVKHRLWSPKILKKHIHGHMSLYYRKKILELLLVKYIRPLKSQILY